MPAGALNGHDDPMNSADHIAITRWGGRKEPVMYIGGGLLLLILIILLLVILF